MSNLPKWIKQKELQCPHCGQNLNLPARTTEAFSIAWEALEELKNIRYESRAKDFVEDSDYPAKNAMRRIEELGK